jgi:hypothetical protein
MYTPITNPDIKYSARGLHGLGDSSDSIPSSLQNSFNFLDTNNNPGIDISNGTLGQTLTFPYINNTYSTPANAPASSIDLSSALQFINGNAAAIGTGVQSGSNIITAFTTFVQQNPTLAALIGVLTLALVANTGRGR